MERLSKKHPNYRLRKNMVNYLRAEGFYNYAMMALELLGKPDNYIAQHHRVSKDVLRGILEGVFGDECNYQENIESFLKNVKTIPGYGLNKIK